MTRSSALGVAYARLTTEDFSAARAFARDVVGLEEVGWGEGGAFRCGESCWSLAFHGDRDGSCLGLSLDDEDIDPTAQKLLAHGFECHFAEEALARSRGVHRLLVAFDGSGNRFELVTRPSVTARRFSPVRDNGVVALQGAGLRSVALDRDLQFWALLPGTRVSDRIGEIVYLSIDALHHRIALFPSNRCGVLNLAFELASLDQLMANYYFVTSRQVKIIQGPGRESASGQIFLHFRAPCDALFSFVADMRTIDPLHHRARQFARSREAFCAWGSEAVDEPDLAPHREPAPNIRQEFTR